MTCPACGGTTAEDGPGCVCPRDGEQRIGARSDSSAGYGRCVTVEWRPEWDAPELPPAFELGGEGG